MVIIAAAVRFAERICMDDKGPEISAMVMIYNEAWQIRDCLDTIKWVDEIVICDSFSDDGTVEICREYTDKIYQRKFDNFANQKKWMLSKPSNRWGLFVEADERFPDTLEEEARSKLQHGDCDGYEMVFHNYCFKWELKGDFWRFKKIKLFKRDKAHWAERLVHSVMTLDGKVGELKTPVIHLGYVNARHWLRKLNYSSRLEVLQKFAEGTNYRWWEIVRIPVSFFTVFYRYYFKRQSYKGGLGGFIVSIVYALYTSFMYTRYFIEKAVRGFMLCRNGGIDE